MKARHIRKLRKVVEKFEWFTIVPSVGLFGDFYAVTSSSTNVYSFKAENGLRAIRKFHRWYFRKHKEHHKFAFDAPFTETTSEWGKFKVVDMKGYARYYK